ncbi:MAG: VWA domain-containing protein [Anaerolineae bacterium]
MASNFSPKVDLKGPVLSKVAGLLLALWLLATLGCNLASLGGPFSRPTPTRKARATLTPTPTRAKPTPTLYPTPEPSLIDSDGDLFPDEVEVAMGNDPFVNECLRQVGCSGTETLIPGEIMNVVIVLDASAGMADEMPGGTRMDLAKTALSQYVESLPPGINVGLMFYGHRGSGDENDKVESCAAIDLVYRVGPVDRVTFKAMLNSAPSVGWAPVAESLLAAQQALAGREIQTNRILLVTSGGDSCGGDSCQVVQEMRQSGVATTIDVIGLNLDYEAIEPLQCVANTTGGLYYSAPTPDELAEAWEALQWREKHWFEVDSCLAPSRDLYLSCRQDELSQFTEWADSTGWTQDHRDPFVAITQALAEEQAELAVPPTPTPTPSATP